MRPLLQCPQLGDPFWRNPRLLRYPLYSQSSQRTSMTRSKRGSEVLAFNGIYPFNSCIPARRRFPGSTFDAAALQLSVAILKAMNMV